MPSVSARRLPRDGWCDDAAVDAAVPVIASCRSRPDASVAATHPTRVRSPMAGPRGKSAARRLVPNQMRRRYAAPESRLQLDGRAGQTGPLRLLRATQRLALEGAVEVLLLREHIVRDPRELLGDDGARDHRRFSPTERAVEGPDLGEVLNGADGGVGEGEPEIAVAIFRPLVSGATAGVPRARHEPAIRHKVAGARETLDAVDLTFTCLECASRRSTPWAPSRSCSQYQL